MITLIRQSDVYVARGEDALRLHDAGCGLHYIQQEPCVLFPAASIRFHLWLALTVDDVAMGGQFYRVSNRRFFQREFTRLMGAAHSKGKWWRLAVADFETQCSSLVMISDSAEVFQPLLF